MAIECLCCGVSEWRTLTRLPRAIFGISASIERCAKCGLGRTNPPPSTDFKHYESEGDSVRNFQQRADDYRGFARELLADSPVRCGRLLDIGCGGGFLIEEAQCRGFDAQGLEANSEIVRWCKSRGLRVAQQNVEDLSRSQAFDLIVISAVLEHLQDPAKLVVSSKQLLSRNGAMLISQASYDGLLPRIAPWGWYGWQPHEHFWHFTPLSFHHFAERYGFHVSIRRRSLYHAWYRTGKNIVRNPFTAIAKLGDSLGHGDSFNAVLTVS